jgi:hypothetical protein
MNAKTLEAVERHGRQLLAIFPNATERDPVALCRKLRRVEAVAHKLAEDCCNWLSMESPEFESRREQVIVRLEKIIGQSGINDDGAIFVNLDPRGYALKIDDAYMREHSIKLHTDWGGYGIIAPDLTN